MPKKNKIPDRTPPKVPFVNRLKNYALINYFKDLPASNTPHYALTINELVKRGLNGCVGLPAKLINLNKANEEIDPFAEYERKL